MEKGKKTPSVLFKIAASIAVILLGVVFLFPETVLPAIRGSVMPANPTHRQATPELASMNQAFERAPMTQERIIASDKALISYKTQFIPGSPQQALLQLKTEMKNEGYSQLKTQAATDGMTIFVRGEEFLGVRFLPGKGGTVVTCCKLSWDQNRPAPKAPAEIKEIVYGNPVVLFNSGNGNPVFVTRTDSGTTRAAERIREKLKNSGWELMTPPATPAENGLIMIMARRGTIFCDVAIMRADTKHGAGNSITYKITHM